MKWVFLVAAVIIVAALIAGQIYIASHRPDMPEEWQALRRGMTRDEVAAACADYDAFLYELKGRDLLTRKGVMFGGPCHWDLDLEFDSQGHLRSGRVAFYHDEESLYDVKRSFPLR